MKTEEKAGHTPEPWLRDGLGIYALHHNGDYENGKPYLVNRFYASVQACTNQGGTMEEAYANARRIVAAVNGCEGIPTEALESGVVGKMREALEKCVDRLQYFIRQDDPELIRARAVLYAIKAKGEL